MHMFIMFSLRYSPPHLTGSQLLYLFSLSSRSCVTQLAEGAHFINFLDIPFPAMAKAERQKGLWQRQDRAVTKKRTIDC